LCAGGGGGDAEEQGHATCVLGVEGCARGVVFEGAIWGVPAVGVYGCAEGGSLGGPEVGEIGGVADPSSEGSVCD
jgi:hypothetical protein